MASPGVTLQENLQNARVHKPNARNGTSGASSPQEAENNAVLNAQAQVP